MGIRILGLFIFFSLVYLGLTFGIPPDSAALTKYNISSTQIQLIRLGLVIPLIAIWMIAFYGYSRIRSYAQVVKDGKEGEGWGYIVKGLLTLALWLPVSSIVNNIGSYIYHQNRDLTNDLVITTNYINLAITLVAFIFLYKGSRRLVKSVKKPLPASLRAGSMVVLVALSGLFAYLALSSSNKVVPIDDATPAAYYLPDWLLVTTIIIPYIVVFYFGFRVVQDIHLYRRNVKGSLYKDALRFLADGIGFVVIVLMILRYFTSLTPAFSDATLKVILLIIYMLIFLIAAGFILIALGAKRLRKLEEV